MFKAIVIAACLVSARAAVTWRDCATKGSQTAVTVHAIDLRPNPVVFPGELHVDLDMTVNQKMDQLFVDVELWKNTSFGESKIPCIGDTNIGTWLYQLNSALLPRIVFKIKDDPTATDNIGCLELNAGIRRKTDPASAVGR
ncbi:hypothetical protein MAR_024596 [Mya arenaria]|uniref:MD-2-related lipid-recognition domain-containing protein n=1 Tax=Mya arenaria TaxID=6604 RepID=A0ABY7DTL3_MYAAR|nr:hypothetical protein MAR_024596 [Mya arenaria]